ncbi:DUF3817 domain-containing protein [Acidithiobacillus montserratensis]|uniref:DUF3817 domain-containing protein n=1 Tax=Acidithiobacillus montserratensis TaxID=2729135 RepID=A0ACD5HH97_9PROT|nr:DUF3817 domain-containing protein [Acidithiobacillus montserratensis]MBU2748863.1 DUF3817 domain-containing protein [Acidithiobacillus montserratensis]
MPDPFFVPVPRLTVLRIFCLVEATVLLTLLLIAVPLKYFAGYPIAVEVLGPIDGFVFLAFGWTVVQALTAGDVSVWMGAKLILAACLPFGGYYSWWSLR